MRAPRMPGRAGPPMLMVIHAALLLALELGLQSLLASTQVVSSLLAPSESSQVFALLVAVLFVVLRITALAVMPALLFATVGSTLVGWALERVGKARP